MKRLFAALFLALVGALVVASGVASADPPNDFTTGGGKIERTVGPPTNPTQIEEKFAFSAHDVDAIGGPTIDDPTSAARNGHFVYELTTTTPTGTTTTLELKGHVSCVWVDGNRAFFNGLIEKSNNPAAEGRFARFDVIDNDQPPGNPAAPDQFLRTGPTPSSQCFRPFSSVTPITSGNIVVNDAQ